VLVGCNADIMGSWNATEHDINESIPIQFKHCFNSHILSTYSQQYNKSYSYLFIHCHGFQYGFVFLLSHSIHYLITAYDVAVEGLAGRKQNSLDKVHTSLQQHALVHCAKELSLLPPYFLPHNCPVVSRLIKSLTKINKRGRVKPVEEAKCFVRQQKDKPGWKP